MWRYEICWKEPRDLSTICTNTKEIPEWMKTITKYKGYGYREQFDRKVKTLRKKGFEIVGMIVDFHKVPEEEFANY